MSAALLAPTRTPYAPSLGHQGGTASASYARDLLRAVGLAFQCQAAGVSIEAALDARSGDEAVKITRALMGALTRSSQSPAMTNVAGWAQELVPVIVGAFVDVLAEQGSTVARLPLQRYTFGPGKLRVPMRRAGSSPNQAAAFFVEGMPIRVGALQLVPVALTAKTMGVISTTTLEMVIAAGEDVMMNVIREGSATDSAKVLDRIFYDANPADAARPAGIQNGLAIDDTAVSTGSDAASIASDLKARYARLLENGFGGPRSVWIMNSLNAATMAELFTEVQVRGTYSNLPIISGLDVPNDTVFLVDCAGIVIAQDVPTVEVATEALLHEEADGDALEVDVLTGVPVRSLFQTNAAALKLILPVDWAVGASGCVQTLTGVAW